MYALCVPFLLTWFHQSSETHRQKDAESVGLYVRRESACIAKVATSYQYSGDIQWEIDEELDLANELPFGFAIGSGQTVTVPFDATYDYGFADLTQCGSPTLRWIEASPFKSHMPQGVELKYVSSKNIGVFKLTERTKLVSNITMGVPDPSLFNVR